MRPLLPITVKTSPGIQKAGFAVANPSANIDTPIPIMTGLAP
ncbi:Uncharacterized protein PPKH_2917 [Pseudomonas putida]|nr:Uncharacterized protein PPKH_2917 [Pseudomonas putida]